MQFYMGQEARIKMLLDHARLVHFFSKAHDVTGRKKLQKMIYILQKCNVPFGEKFQFHFYGPYSEELTLRIEELCNLHLLEEIKEDKGNYYRYNYTITEDGDAFLSQFDLEMPVIDRGINLLQAETSRFLELVATMLYFGDLSKIEVEQKIATVKPKQKYTEAELASAWSFIATLQTEVH